MKKKDVVIGVAGLALAATTIAGVTGWQKERQRVADLEAQVADLRQQAKRSAVSQSISLQMEEIANQQRAISDEQRTEAIQQRHVAEEMRMRSEVERQKALVAQNQAIASEQQAQEARHQAEAQQQIAEHQRAQAEYSKQVADTLSYLALGRSLGSLATNQFQSGNKDLANLLSYASYIYTSRYKGDVYYPAVFQAMTQTSQSKRTWSIHDGALSCISFMPKGDDRMVTASTYGELTIHRLQADGDLVSTQLLSNSIYDFRDIYISQAGTIYATSRSGHLVIATPAGVLKILPLEQMPHPMGVTLLNDKQLLVIAEDDLAVLDMEKAVLTGQRHLDFHVISISRSANKPLLFDNQGRRHLITDLYTQQSEPLSFKGQVTAYAESKSTKTSAYGMSDGTIYLVSEKGNATRLVGHRSRISRLKVDGWRLYSASYDGTLNQWTTNSDKIEPVTLLSIGQWIMNFNFDNPRQHLCVGDQNGNLSTMLLSIPVMAERVKNQLKNDFTPNEWDYYIGKNVPFESFIGQAGKEVKK